MPRVLQGSLFRAGPEGLEQAEDFVTPPEERALLDELERLQFRPFAFQGWLGRRETVSFGWRYDFNDSRMHEAPPIPEFLLALHSLFATAQAAWPGPETRAPMLALTPLPHRPSFSRVAGRCGSGCIRRAWWRCRRGRPPW